ncbi:hypothetical protein [Streptomyces sp. NPDC050704]|uniref:hypothetical protein n=1 Tax=Streptomyces sp. NPDC050704 TaxID=3157219 RepID=UPI0034436F5A
MDGEAGPDLAVDQVEEVPEVGRRVAGRPRGDDRAGGGVERREQIHGAATEPPA